jgi:hypothetical protein
MLEATIPFSFPATQKFNFFSLLSFFLFVNKSEFGNGRCHFGPREEKQEQKVQTALMI